MSQHLTEHDELVSDVVACQLVIKQILDVIDVIAPVEVREKMTTQLKAIDFASHPASADPVTLRAVQKAIALIELKFTRRKKRINNRPRRLPAGPSLMGNDGLRWRRLSIFKQFAVAPALFVAMADQILHDNPHVRRNIADFTACFNPRDFLQHHQMRFTIQFHLLTEDDGGQR
jgi:hypothetical protein